MAKIFYGANVPLAESTVPPATPDGDPLTNGPWYDVYGRQVLYGANIATGTQDVSEVAPWGTQIMEETFAQLTAAGDTAAINVEVYHHHTFHYTIANIDTNVVVGIDSSLDNTNWVRIGTTTTQTANGTYEFEIDSYKTKYLRFSFDSEAGGANATIDVLYMGGN